VVRALCDGGGGGQVVGLPPGDMHDVTGAGSRGIGLAWLLGISTGVLNRRQRRLSRPASALI